MKVPAIMETGEYSQVYQPKSLPKNEERLSLDETSDLFGSSFLHSMVKNADNDAKLRGVVHASG
jgi:hypothetical protein